MWESFWKALAWSRLVRKDCQEGRGPPRLESGKFEWARKTSCQILRITRESEQLDMA
ncbi:mCG148400 [Mus musculus]|nr:mCG148400 [Mus musculus]